MTCKLCRSSTDFGKSHIIPESFFREGGSVGETPLMLSSNAKVYPKRRPIGVYDQTILCKSCETKFSDWDDYGKKFLLDEFEAFSQIKAHDKIVGYSTDVFDYEKLKLFFVSVLWRASISSQPFFEHVDLGSHEARLKEIIDSRTPPGPDDYACILYRFSGFPDPLPILMPLKTRSSYGLTYYRIYLGSYFLDIKVDRQPTPKQFSAGTIQRGEPLVIVAKDIKECREAEIFRKIVNAPQNDNAI
jgi:hypothetical protein